jgi:hypothetical protein
MFYLIQTHALDAVLSAFENVTSSVFFVFRALARFFAGSVMSREACTFALI